MKARLGVVCCAVIGLCWLGWMAGPGVWGWRGGQASCSTFLLAEKGTLLVGHNLDEGFDTPGQIVVNKRGVEKQNVSWEDLKIGGKSDVPRITWVSKFGSVTYNTLGKDFIDGGLNEAGLYVGEMTLLGSKYPSDPKLPKLYHHQWMQYLLDNFESVPQVLDSLEGAMLDGHCQWHFFVADGQGNAAVIEFLEGKIVIHAGADLPVKVLGNLSYHEELKASKAYEGFGGTKKAAFQDRENGRRFVWGGTMLADYARNASGDAGSYAFSILKQLDKGATRWSLVYDVPGKKLSWRTDKAPQVRFVDFSAFDFSCAGPPMVLDIHQSFAGDAAKRFAPYTDEENRQAVKAALKQWDMGFAGNTFLKPRMVDKLSAAAAGFRCGR